MKIFVINPGSTSTKLALFENEKVIWAAGAHHSSEDLQHFHHVNEQYEYRRDFIFRLLAEAGIPIEFDAVIARGGLLKPTPGGVYAINEQMKYDLLHARMEHACNLGALIADEMAKKCGCPAYIADPEVVDELQPAARYTGIPEIERISIFHALNQKAVAKRYAKEVGKNYEDLNLIVVHMGGGVSVGAHKNGKVVDVANALDGDGPFSPERSGGLPTGALVKACFSGKYTQAEVGKMLNGNGGFNAYVGSNDMRDLLKMIEEGDKKAEAVVDAFHYQLCKEIGAMSVVLGGKVDQIILTGGIAYSAKTQADMKNAVEWIAPVTVYPGEDELLALAQGALRVMNGEEEAKVY